MKSGMKALCFAFTLIGAAACSPAHAAPAAAKSEPVQQVATQKEPVADAKAKAASSAEANDGVVSINSASAEELAQVMNGVGLKKAQSIVTYREEYGPFKELQQLQEVPGIGSALVERNRMRIKL